MIDFLLKVPARLHFPLGKSERRVSLHVDVASPSPAPAATSPLDAYEARIAFVAI